MAAEGMPLPWRWNGGTISTVLDVIWGMSAERSLYHFVDSCVWIIILCYTTWSIISGQVALISSPYQAADGWADMSDNQSHDRYERAFLQRFPREVVHSFSDQQIAAIKTAIGGERWDSHVVDLRGVMPLLRWYFVFVAGPVKRKKRRLGLDDRPKSNILGRIVSAATMLLGLALLAVLLFY